MNSAKAQHFVCSEFIFSFSVLNLLKLCVSIQNTSEKILLRYYLEMCEYQSGSSRNWLILEAVPGKCMIASLTKLL